MRLEDFVETTGATLTRLARFSGVSRSMLVNICNGKNEPTVGLAIKIERATGGAVTLYDLAKQPKKQTQTKKKKDAHHQDKPGPNLVENIVNQVDKLG